MLDANPANYLAWLPDVPKNQGKPLPRVVRLMDLPMGDPPTNTLIADFKELVRGAGEFGCGLEAQLEAWYRFLVQPDPWFSIDMDMSEDPPAAQLVGVDVTLLQQRHDFLRPDSLLVIVVITDEEDSWSDPMWQRGRGWITRTGQLPAQYGAGQALRRGTSVCEQPVNPNDPMNTGPNSPACSWCGYKGTEGDPKCSMGPYLPTEDSLNVRYTDDMKRRYGMNPQFPIKRYVEGLQNQKVPDRVSEHTTSEGNLSAGYVGRPTCINPIFAKSLPTDPNGDLCNLPLGTRSKELIYLTVIGGVPWQLLTDDPKNPSSAFKSALSDDDWKKLLGKNPATFQLEGIDPHMEESIKPRGLACGPTAPNNCDPFHGREWDTSTSMQKVDLQYACTFTLPKAKDCTKLSTLEGATCDCGMNSKSPLCDPNPNDNNNLTLQTRGKAYPTIRQFRVVKELGPNGVIASLCPRTLDSKSKDYGYRPAFRILVDRIRNRLL